MILTTLFDTRTDTRCLDGHRYYDSRLVTADGGRACAVCHQALVDWHRVHRLAVNEINYLFDQLPREAVRAKWWTEPLDAAAEAALVRLRARGGVRERIERRLVQSLNRLYRQPNGRLTPFRDGRQTPYTGNVLYYAQHATATCCRRCVACWHGISEGREITPVELAYLVQLVLAYLEKRFALRDPT
jgi:hypothetical protein